MTVSNVSLFEYLGIADQERIHTQVLAWLLNPKVSPLDNDDLKNLYKNLFDLELTDLNGISVSTEYKNIDLVIESSELIIGVENKLKSSQAVDQLKKYKESLNKINVNNRLYFLTFSGEVDLEERCKNIDYEFLFKSLEKCKQDNHYVVDYLNLLNRMLSARDYFLMNISSCSEVFRRSGMSTETRVKDIIKSSNKDILFICNNRLERLFVQIYLRKITAQLILTNSTSSIFVSESNGQALLQVYFNDLIFHVNSESFLPGFQFQSSTIKYNVVICSEEYKNSKKLDETNTFVKFLDSKFETDTFQINMAKTRSYRSYSQKVKPDFLFQEYSILTTTLKNNIEDCYKKWKEIHEVHLQNHSII